MNATSFFCGVYMITFAAAALFFLKFYRATGDRFFRYFSSACALLAVERIALFFVDNPFTSVPNAETESQSLVYVFRLIAFLLILFAIVEKNRQSKKSQ